MVTLYTGRPCTCRPGIQRDNCPQCEGSGKQIDFVAMSKAPKERCPDCGGTNIGEVDPADGTKDCLDCGCFFPA